MPVSIITDMWATNQLYAATSSAWLSTTYFTYTLTVTPTSRQAAGKLCISVMFGWRTTVYNDCNCSSSLSSATYRNVVIKK